MPTLIACLSSGKGTWAEVSRIIAAQQWSKVFLITDKFGSEKFQANKAEFVLINTFDTLDKLIVDIKAGLKGITDFEVALNLVSGSGKEHMALMEAVLELGLNFRLVTIDTNNQLKVLGLERN